MAGYLVIGMGRFGRSIAGTLYENKKTVLAIDSDEEIIQQIIDRQIVEEAVVMDTTDENALKKVVNKDDFDTAFVCIGADIHSSILTTLLLKEMGIRQVICKAKEEKQGKVLEKIGADMIVYPEKEMGRNLVMKVINPDFIEHFKFSDKFGVFEFKAPKKFVGKNLIQLNLRNRYGMNIIGIRLKNSTLDINPKPEMIIEENSTLLVIADREKSKEFIENSI